MEYKFIDKKTKIPVLGLGTWGFGGFRESDFSQDEESICAIKAAINVGYTLIDTAELYGAGHTEELVGKAIKDIDQSTLFIISKVFKTNLKYNDVLVSCKNSLERLCTNYLDLYLIHAPNPDIPLSETMRAMDELVEKKFVRFIGVSNFSVEQMKEAQIYSQHKIVVNQIPYNLSARNKDYRGYCVNMESEIIPYCQQNGILIMAHRPLERGFLLQSHQLLDSLSKKYNKTKAQIAINWLLSKKNIITIPKSVNPEHMKENLDALGWKLDDIDMQLLDETEFSMPSA